MAGTPSCELNAINPFTEEHFKEVSKRFTEWATEAIETSVGWMTLLDRYRFNESSWKMNTFERRERNNILRGALASGQDQEIDQAVNRISCDWAGLTPRFTTREVHRLVGSFTLLDAMRENHGRWEELYVGGEDCNPNARIAPVSAIYEHYDLDSWIFYSSRVGESIAHLVSKYSAECGRCEELNYLGLRTPPGARRLPKGFAVINTKRQARLSFFYASWMCKAIARIISEKSLSCDSMLKPCHVEMALWSFGR